MEENEELNDESLENHDESQDSLIKVTGMYKDWFLDYASYVILERAVPAIEDGFKPVQRRIMHALKELDDGRYNKVANVVGHTMQYHPHGDASIADAMVQIGQKDLLIDTQGNWGNILTGDGAAAPRYIEARLSKFALEVVYSPKITEWQLSYDGRKKEPVNLPVKFPLLLAQGAEGIAVGLSTKILPHNFNELIDASIKHLKGKRFTIYPDFPTAGIINGAAGINQAYHTGRGSIRIRGVADFEQDKNGRDQIVVTELPYQVNKARLIEKIAELVKEKKIEGISELRDESDKDGMRMVVDLKRGEVPEVVLNNLYKHTQLQASFGINMVALIDGLPKLLNLKEILAAFIKHRREVVTRRTIYLLRKARERAHILEGLAVALGSIDEIITTIKRYSRRFWRTGVGGYLCNL